MSFSDNEAREVGLALGERCATCRNFLRDDNGAATCREWMNLPRVLYINGTDYAIRLSFSRLSHWLESPEPRPWTWAEYLDFGRQAATLQPCVLYERAGQ